MLVPKWLSLSISVLFRLISTFNNDTHDVFQGDTSVANEKWSISWEQGKLCSDWWFADPSTGPIHGSMIKAKQMYQERVQSNVVPTQLPQFSSRPTPPAIPGLTAQTASIGSGHEAQASGSVLLQHSKAEQPVTDQHKALPAASAAQSSAVEGTVSGEEGGAAHTMYQCLRTSLPRPEALASTAESPVCLWFSNACHASPHHRCILSS